MAKLTEEQRIANKLVAKNRAAAYSARRKVYELAQSAALAVFHAQPLRAQMEEANAKFDEALAKVHADRVALSKEIAKLQQRMDDLQVVHNTEALNLVRRESNTAYYEGLSAAELQVKLAFPDIANVYSSAEWESRVTAQAKSVTVTES